jgi:hypothetical protein
VWGASFGASATCDETVTLVGKAIWRLLLLLGQSLMSKKTVQLSRQPVT